MPNTEQITKQYLRTDLPDIKVGDTIKAHQKIKQGDKERIQIFEGVVIAKKHGKGLSGTLTVRRIIGGVGVERTFPLHSPALAKIEVVGRNKVRRAKLYYLRDKIGKKAKLKRKAFVPETPTETEEKNKI